VGYVVWRVWLYGVEPIASACAGDQEMAQPGNPRKDFTLAPIASVAPPPPAAAPTPAAAAPPPPAPQPMAAPARAVAPPPAAASAPAAAGTPAAAGPPGLSLAVAPEALASRTASAPANTTAAAFLRGSLYNLSYLLSCTLRV